MTQCFWSNNMEASVIPLDDALSIRETPSSQRRRSYISSIVLALILTACHTPLPAQYVEQAEQGVTLTSLTASPQQYRDKVVILGGVLVKEREEGGQVWLHLKNRPLDPKYHPHRPISLDGPEAGHFWVTVANREQLPPRYRQWARMTVVGRVIGTTKQDQEPILLLMYARGWDYSGNNEDAWEASIDPAYVPSIPEGLHGEFQTQ
jgi:starvation-inducible outer membrane lipoprotein